jgi:hypothetical protein
MTQDFSRRTIVLAALSGFSTLNLEGVHNSGDKARHLWDNL